MGEHTLFAACRCARTFLSPEFSRFPQVTTAASDTHARTCCPGGWGRPQEMGGWSPILSLYPLPRLPSLGSKTTRMGQTEAERKAADQQGLGNSRAHPSTCLLPPATCALTAPPPQLRRTPLPRPVNRGRTFHFALNPANFVASPPRACIYLHRSIRRSEQALHTSVQIILIKHRLRATCFLNAFCTLTPSNPHNKPYEVTASYSISYISCIFRSGDHVKKRVPSQQVWGRARDSAFITSFQERSMPPAPKSSF